MRGLGSPAVQTPTASASSSAYAQLVAAGLVAAGPGTRKVCSSTGTGTAGPRANPAVLATATARGTAAVGAAGINYAGIPLPYAFSRADISRAGSSKPVHYRGTTGVCAWSGLGSAIPPKIAVRSVSADPSASNSGGANVLPMIRTGSNLYVRNNTRVPSAGSGIGTRIGQAGREGKCMHRRCEGCYDLDFHKRVVRFCGGSSVDPNRYAEWYASFGFVDGIEPRVVDGGWKARQREWRRGADVPVLELGGGVSDGEEREAPRSEYEDVRLGEGVEHRGVSETGEERFLVRGEEVLVSGSRNDTSGDDAVTELPRDGLSRPYAQPRTRIPACYTTGESRILRIQVADESDDDGDSGEDKAAKASSDEGEGVFGRKVDDEEGADGDESESESGGSRGWVESITFVHRGSQEGGGSSESEDDEKVVDGIH